MTGSRYAEVQAFVTNDGSVIRELMHPAVHGNANPSLAEAIVGVGQPTPLHRHHRSEQIYHITSGAGRMSLGAESFDVAIGDTIVIPPGTPHCIRNTGPAELKFLCACAPAYSHGDTERLTP